MPARFILTFSKFRPITAVPHIECPILYVQPSWDSVVPNHLIPVAAQASRSPRTRIVQSDAGHFDLYLSGFPDVCPKMVEFLKEELKE